MKDSMTIALSCFWIHLTLASSILPALRCRTYRCKAQIFFREEILKNFGCQRILPCKNRCVLCVSRCFFLANFIHIKTSRNWDFFKQKIISPTNSDNTVAGFSGEKYLG